MIRVLLFEPETGDLVQGGEGLIDHWKKSDSALIWVDLHNEPDLESEAGFMEELGIHPLAIKDAQRDRHPPKLEMFHDWTFILLRGLDAVSDSINLKTIQLSVFVSSRMLLTRHVGQSVSVDIIWKEICAEPEAGEEMREMLPASVATRISKCMAKRYLPIMLGLESRLGELEDQLIDGATDDLLAELIGYKTRLRKMRRSFRYHETVFRRLRDAKSTLFGESLKHEVADVYESAERLHSLADMYYEVSGDLIEGYISIASHKLNHIIKVLTIVTTIFVPLGFLAGVYGMNFEHIPELHHPYGYFILLSVMGVLVVSLLSAFRYRKWI